MSEDELVALRAARVLAAHNFAEASGVIDAALSSDNVWVRLHAMEASEDVPASPGRSLWEMMKDDDPWVRFRAAAATLVRCRRTTTPDRVLADRP